MQGSVPSTYVGVYPVPNHTDLALPDLLDLLTIVNKGRYLFGVVMEKGVSKWGVIPYRGIDSENLEFLIVTTKNGNWGLPKGNLMKKLGAKETALQEAYEEAGIIQFL